MIRCTWCKNPNATEDDGTLCRGHQAENEGVTVDQLDSRDAIWAAEEADCR